MAPDWAIEGAGQPAQLKPAPSSERFSCDRAAGIRWCG